MKDYLKFLNKLPKDLRLRIIHAVDKIAANKTTDLDIKLLSAPHTLYRCRVGKVRILFQNRDNENYILDIGFRGNIYKKLKNYF
jgi:mRNA-degrading endonuclease RelE of RelBE toxin-antitoxin system